MSHNDCFCYFHQIKTWLWVTSDQVSPETEDDFKVKQGGAWAGEASFVCLAEYGYQGPHPASQRMSGQLTPLWLPQVSWWLSLLCCLNTMLRAKSKQCQAPHVTALVSHYLTVQLCPVLFTLGLMCSALNGVLHFIRQRGTCQMATPANTIIANFPLTEFYTILTTLK